MSKRTNKLDMERILVAGCNSSDEPQAFAAGTLVGAGTALGVLNGQLGVVAWDPDGTAAYGTFLDAGTLANARAVKVVQGTPASADITTADPWEVSHMAVKESGILRAGNVRSITVQKPRAARMSSHAFMDFTAPEDNTEYGLYIQIESVRNDRKFGNNDEVLHAFVETPDYTALGTTNPTDHLLRHLAFEVNKQSKHVRLSNGAHSRGNRNILALGINVSGAGTGTAIGTITCGDTIDIMTDTDSVTGAAVTTSVVVDYPFLLALAYQIAKQARILALTNPDDITGEITGTSEIQVIDLSTAGTPVAGQGVDALLFLGLPETKSVYFDNIEQVMTDITVGLTGGFTVALPYGVKGEPDEGTGQGWKWIIENERAQLGVHTMQLQPKGEFFSEGAKYIDPDGIYTSYIVDYFDTENTLTKEYYNPKQLTLLLCTDLTCPTVADAATAYTTNLTPATPKVEVVTATVLGCCGYTGIDPAPGVTVDDVSAILTGWIVLHNPNVAINDNNPYDTSTGLV